MIETIPRFKKFQVVYCDIEVMQAIMLPSGHAEQSYYLDERGVVTDLWSCGETWNYEVYFDDVPEIPENPMIMSENDIYIGIETTNSFEDSIKMLEEI